MILPIYIESKPCHHSVCCPEALEWKEMRRLRLPGRSSAVENEDDRFPRSKMLTMGPTRAGYPLNLVIV